MSINPEMLKTELIPDTAYIGETVIYRIELTRPEDISVRLPSDPDISPFSLNGARHHSERAGGGLIRDVFELEIGIYTLEEAEIPSFDLVVETAGGTESLTVPPGSIAIRSLIEEAGESPREMAPPDTVWVPDYTILKALGVAVAVFLVLLLIARLVSKFRNRKRTAKAAPPPPPPRPPHEIALKALDALRSEDLVRKGHKKQFFFRLSEIIREYIGTRYGFDALEMTTTELLGRMARISPPGLVFTSFRIWSEFCDMVKFAGYEPENAECEKAFYSAIGFVKNTITEDISENSNNNKPNNNLPRQVKPVSDKSTQKNEETLHWGEDAGVSEKPETKDDSFRGAES